MGYPTILVNSSSGSDSEASGAGPSTAIKGSKARVQASATGALRVGFFDASVDLTSLWSSGAPAGAGDDAVTDGEDALYVVDSVAGNRNFDQITSVKDPYDGLDNFYPDTPWTCDTSVGSDTISNISDTALMNEGDIIMIEGAGPLGADLYTTINSIVNSNTITINDTASLEVFGANLYLPAQCTVFIGLGQGTGGIRTTDTAWAIGGKRASIGSTSSRKLFNNNTGDGDAMPGWTIELESGHTETLSATLTIYREGSSNGPITLKGSDGAATMPVLTWTNNGTGINNSSSPYGWRIENLDFRNSNASKTASLAINATSLWSMRNLRINHSTNYWGRGINGSAGQLIENCNLAYMAGYTGGSSAIVMTTGALGIKIIGNSIYGVTGNAINITMSSTNSIHAFIFRNSIYGNTKGIATIDGTGTASNTYFGSIIENTIHGNSSDGIDFGTNASTTNGWSFAQVINNNITGNGGWGINFSHASPPTLAQLNYANTFFWNNNFGTGALANTSGSMSISGLDYGSISVDPGYTDVSDADISLWNFAVGTGVKALGWPTNKIGNTQSYVDIGVAQRQESGTSSYTEQSFAY